MNNAGVQHVSPLEDFSTERWDAVLAIKSVQPPISRAGHHDTTLSALTQTVAAVSLTAAFHTTRLALPHMRRQNWGRIINIASVHGKVASPYKSAYVAAKHGMLGLTKVTALETADTAITANSVCPGWVMTELVAAQVRSNAEAAGIPFEQAATELLSVRAGTEPRLSGPFV